MPWSRIKKIGGLVITLTGLIGLVTVPEDLTRWGLLAASLGDRLPWLAPTVVGLLLLFTPDPRSLWRNGAAVSATVEAPATPSGQLGASAEPVEPLADRLESLAEAGKTLRDRIENDRSFGRQEWRPAHAEWKEQATRLLREETPLHIVIFQRWGRDEPPPSVPPIGPAWEWKQLLWELRNEVSALKEIAQRVRAAEGDDLERDAARRARLKDLLLKAEQRRDQLHEWIQLGRASKEEVHEWDLQLTRVIHAALDPETARAALYEERYPVDALVPPVDMPNPSLDSYSAGSPEIATDAEAIKVLTERWRWLPGLQRSLDGMDLREDFEPRAWERVWD